MREKSTGMATALLVLDMLGDFITGKLANPAAEQVIEPIGALAGVARSRGDWVVVYGSDAHQAGDLELAVFGEHAMAGSSGARVTGALTPQAGDIAVPKRFYSGVYPDGPRRHPPGAPHRPARGDRPAHRLPLPSHQL